MNLPTSKCAVTAWVCLALPAVALAQGLTVSVPPIPIGALSVSTMAFDEKLEQLVALSLNAPGTAFGTFALTYGSSATTWTNLNTTLPIGASLVGGEPSLAFDLTTTSGTVFSMLNGVWTPIPLTSSLRPPVTNHYGLARLPSGDVLLFGGASPSSNISSATWLFKGDHWVDLTSQIATPPPARNSQGMCGTSTGAILVGGTGAAGFLSDTWVFSKAGLAWTPLAASLPAPRTIATLTFDSRLNTVLFGGAFNPAAATWGADVFALDLSVAAPSWTQLSAGLGLRPGALAYEARHDETIAVDVTGPPNSFVVVHDLLASTSVGVGCTCTSSFGNSFLGVRPISLTGDVHIPDIVVFTMFRAAVASPTTSTFLVFGSSAPVPPTPIPGFGPGCSLNLDPATVFQTLTMPPGLGSLPTVTFIVPPDLTLVGASALVQAIQFNPVSNCSTNARLIRLRR